MADQLSIFGTSDHVGRHKDEVRDVCEQFPRAAEDPGLFAFNVLKKRHAWIAQLSEQQQHDLRQFARDWPSLNRRRQEFRSNIPTV